MKEKTKAMHNGEGRTPPPEVSLTPKGVTEHVTGKVLNFDSRLGIAMVGLMLLTVLGVVGFLVRVFGDDGGFSDEARHKWGYYAAMFGFLLVTAGSAPVAAIGFRWTKNHWRRPLSRASELFAVVGVLQVLWFIPLIFLLPEIDLNGDGAFAVGQDRRTIWMEVPIGAPLWWDTAAVVALALCGLAILWVSARPDMLELAQRSNGSRTKLWSRLALGWRGTERDWVVQKGFLAVLGAFYFMLLIFVHTLISLDFALSLVPGWKDSIFAPYHALTGMQAASGMLIFTMFLMRNYGGYRQYLSVDPFWCFSKVLLGLTLLWGYFWFSEFMTFWYGRDPAEQSIIKLIMFESYKTAFLLNFFFSFLIPFGLLLWNGMRKSVIGPTLAGVSVVIGAFFMMVRVYVPAFNIRQEDLGLHSLADLTAVAGKLPVSIDPVLPDVWDVFIILGGLGAAALIYLLGTRIVPIMSLWETKEGLLYILFRPFIKGRYMVLGKPE